MPRYRQGIAGIQACSQRVLTLMNVVFFFKHRTDFIRKFYDEAVRPFLRTQKLIEAEEEPYVPPYSEDGEPPFLEEWIEADTSIQIVGRTAISLLSESLKVYFIQWDELLGTQCSKYFKDEFKKGYWSGYRRCFSAAYAIDWTKCPAEAEIIEQVALARNLSQHAGRISQLSIRHPRDLRERFPNPIFVPEYEKNLEDDELTSLSWLGSDLVITRDALSEAIRQTELLVDWLEPQFQSDPMGFSKRQALMPSTWVSVPNHGKSC
jgi:hypothetical protein